MVAEGLHNALSDLKLGKSNIFKYYSLLMHIFLYKGLKVWHPDLGIITKVRGEPLPVQEWMYVWDSYSNRSNYLIF